MKRGRDGEKSIGIASGVDAETLRRARFSSNLARSVRARRPGINLNQAVVDFMVDEQLGHLERVKARIAELCKSDDFMAIPLLRSMVQNEFRLFADIMPGVDKDAQVALTEEDELEKGRTGGAGAGAGAEAEADNLKKRLCERLYGLLNMDGIQLINPDNELSEAVRDPIYLTELEAEPFVVTDGIRTELWNQASFLGIPQLNGKMPSTRGQILGPTQRNVAPQINDLLRMLRERDALGQPTAPPPYVRPADPARTERLIDPEPARVVIDSPPAIRREQIPFDSDTDEESDIDANDLGARAARYLIDSDDDSQNERDEAAAADTIARLEIARVVERELNIDRIFGIQGRAREGGAGEDPAMRFAHFRDRFLREIQHQPDQELPEYPDFVTAEDGTFWNLVERTTRFRTGAAFDPSNIHFGSLGYALERHNPVIEDAFRERDRGRFRNLLTLAIGLHEAQDLPAEDLEAFRVVVRLLPIYLAASMGQTRPSGLTELIFFNYWIEDLVRLFVPGENALERFQRYVEDGRTRMPAEMPWVQYDRLRAANAPAPANAPVVVAPATATATPPASPTATATPPPVISLLDDPLSDDEITY